MMTLKIRADNKILETRESKNAMSQDIFKRCNTKICITVQNSHHTGYSSISFFEEYINLDGK